MEQYQQQQRKSVTKVKEMLVACFLSISKCMAFVGMHWIWWIFTSVSEKSHKPTTVNLRAIEWRDRAKECQREYKKIRTKIRVSKHLFIHAGNWWEQNGKWEFKRVEIQCNSKWQKHKERRSQMSLLGKHGHKNTDKQNIQKNTDTHHTKLNNNSRSNEWHATKFAAQIKCNDRWKNIRMRIISSSTNEHTHTHTLTKKNIYTAEYGHDDTGRRRYHRTIKGYCAPLFGTELLYKFIQLAFH